MNNELIVVEQLPIIKARLEQISTEIKEKVDRANSLVVNDETVKEVKQVRAELNKEFNELEAQRKAVKNAIMLPYEQFEEFYKVSVSNLYKNADIELKTKIDNVENQLKQEKEDELKTFAEQWFISKGIENIVNFENIGLNITLSASMKSLKEQIIAFCEKVFNEIKLIELEEYKDEILVEYKKNKDFTKSKLDVIARHKALEEIQKQQKEVQLQIDEDAKIVEKVNEIITPKEIIDDDEIITCTFTLTSTKQNIKKIKDLIMELGVEYK